MGESLEFDRVDVFTVGAVGEPGQRIFYVQMQSLGEVVSLRLEKQQVAAIADYLDGMLDDAPHTDEPVADLTDSFTAPSEDLFTVQSIGAAFEAEGNRFVLYFEELTEGDDPAAVLVGLQRHQIEGFIPHARALVEAGRPPCPFCGRPLQGPGSFCPCSN